MSIRILAFLLPLAGSFLVIRALSDVMYRGNGRAGLAFWVLQAAMVGFAISMAVDRVTRRLLPLAALFGMSLVFPDEAPSRFSVALRAGTAKNLRAKATAVRPIADATDPSAAATEALAMVAALAQHDRLTRGHTERVRAYSDLIGQQLGLAAEDQIRLSWAGLLHDVGKLTVPPDILNKKGKPDDTEWAILRSHPEAGAEMLGPLAGWLGEWTLAASEHHERWDGDGYPLGLVGKEISLAGRIVAVADAYDVITSRRSYKRPLTAEAARRELVRCSGNQFDPAVVRAFLNVSLGRRWLVGPFAWLADLPFAPLGTAVSRVPAAAAAAAVAITASTVLLPPEGATDTLAFGSPRTTVSVVDNAAPLTTTTSLPPPSSPEPPTTIRNDSERPSSTVSTPDPVAKAPTSEVVTAPSLSTSTTVSASTTAAPTTTTPTTAAPPAGNLIATTSTDPVASKSVSTTTTLPTPKQPPPPPAPPPPPPPTTTTTTTAVTSTASSSTTSTVAPTTTLSTTTTTTAPTTTTMAPLTFVYYLKNDGTGETRFQLFNDLSTDGPDNAILPNYDTSYDSVPGLRLLPTTAGAGEWDAKKKHTFFLDLNGSSLTGSPSMKIWVATDADLGGAPVPVTTVLRDCNAFLTECSDLSEASASAIGPVTSGFTETTLDFGSVNHTFAAGRRLVLLIFSEGGQTLHVGYDANDTPSSLTLQIQS